MHVLVTADAIGGVWTYTRELVTGLVRRGHRVTLVTFGEIPTHDQTKWLDDLHNVDFRATAFHLEWMQEAQRDMPLSAEYLLSTVEEVRPDILHLNQYAYGALETDIPKIVVGHSDVVSWWVSVKGEMPPEDSWTRWYYQTVRSGVQQADAVIAPSAWMLENIRLYYAQPWRSHVIYNGRSPLLFNPHITKEERVLSVGRLWDSGKQVSLLLEQESTWPVTIAGVDRHPDEVLRNDSQPRHEARGRVSFQGNRNEDQLRLLYAKTAIYVGSSRYEPFGLAPLEAALSRCALVMNDIPSFREIWGDAAVYFSWNSAQALQDVLTLLASNRETRLMYGNRAYERACQHFTADRMVDDYLGLYQNLIPSRTVAA